MSQHPPSPAPLPTPGVSGKWLTWIVLLTLVGVGVSLSYTLWTYNRLEVARAETSQAWRQLTEQLIHRYSAVQLALHLVGSSDSENSELHEQFRQAADRFRTTSLPHEQQAMARKLETLMGNADLLPPETTAPNVTPQLREATADYNRSRLAEQQMRLSLGGRLLGIFINFPQSLPFQLSE
ncbi:MAG: hypothetical protein KDA45_05990 [Planctomycetales bacterium]|nr:hypothetical protein [Planctomycetales bacterium]